MTYQLTKTSKYVIRVTKANGDKEIRSFNTLIGMCSFIRGIKKSDRLRNEYQLFFEQAIAPNTKLLINQKGVTK